MHIAPSALEPAQSKFTIGQPRPGQDEPNDRGGRPRRRPQRFVSMMVLAAVVAVAGSVGVISNANSQVEKIQRVEGLDGVFSPAHPNIENFLLVGSDSRAGADPSDPDFAGIGSVGDTSGNRSDTVMVLRRDKNGGEAALLSLPRDLWVDIPGRGNERINTAYNDGPATLIGTVQRLGIPIHHYVEIDFQGFKALVDAIGGVSIGFWVPGRDVHTGFYVPTGGDHVLDGVQALAYARSRYYENYIDGMWVPDVRSDLGRIERQQNFINLALNAAIARVKSNPLEAGEVLASMTEAVRLDPGLDVLEAAGALKDAVSAGLQTYTPPVYNKTVDNKAVLLLGENAPAYFDYFSGNSTTPPVPA